MHTFFYERPIVPGNRYKFMTYHRRMVMSVRTVVDMKFFGNWPFYVHGTENYVLI